MEFAGGIAGKLRELKAGLRLTRALQWLTAAVSAPVVKTPGIFAAMMLMLTAVPWVHYVWIKPGKVLPVTATEQMLSVAAVLVWAALAVYLLIRKWKRPVACTWLVLCFIPLTANWLIDLVLMVVYERFFTADIAAVILASNPDEAGNFVSAYGSNEALLYLVGSVVLFVGSYFALSSLRKVIPGSMHRPLRVLAVVLMATAAYFMATMPDTDVTKTNICGKIDEFYKYDSGHEIVPSGVPIVTDPSAAPQKIVVIVGESLSRSHCSLYGYEKQTQPLLEKLVADSSLVVFDNPTAPALHTMSAFKHFIGTWNGEADRNWYECPTFLEMARRSGYRLSWLSNQSPKGFYDNPVTKIAEFCDRMEFTGDGMNGSTCMRMNCGLDSLLIPMAQKWNDKAKDLSVIHLMGSHVAYHLRYPRSYSHFTMSDYDKPTKRQRNVLSCYDNTVLYNDMVVSRLMKLYDSQDAVVVYFSDHAQDMFEVDENYFGHGRDNVPASMAAAAAIPMMVYMTPEFRRRHPDTEARIRQAAATPFNTTDLTLLLMDIMHTSFADKN